MSHNDLLLVMFYFNQVVSASYMFVLDQMKINIVWPDAVLKIMFQLEVGIENILQSVHRFVFVAVFCIFRDRYECSTLKLVPHIVGRRAS